MEARQYAALRRWIDPEDSDFNEQRTLLLAVLANFIETHPRDDLSGLVESLFPGFKGPVSALWDSARVFAACGRYAQAFIFCKLAVGHAVLRRCQKANEIVRLLIDSDATEPHRAFIASTDQNPTTSIDDVFDSTL